MFLSPGSRAGRKRVIPVTVTVPPVVPVRQTVLAGPVDSSGYPNFWPATSASLTLTMQNVPATPLVIAIAKGFGATGAIDSLIRRLTNDAILLPASQTSYIYYDDTGAIGSTIIAPIYQRGGTISVTSGQYTFDIVAWQGYLGNGATAPAVNRTFVGEAIAGASTITSTVCYAYQRRYTYTDGSALPAAATAVSKNSNLGVTLGIEKKLTIINTITQLGYAVGDDVQPLTSGLAGDYQAFNIWITRNALGFTVGSNSAWGVTHKTTGVASVTTAADWVYRLEAWSIW